MFLGRLAASPQAGQPPTRPAQTRRPVWAIDRRIELADGVHVGAWIGKAETAFLALDDGEPEARASRGGVRSFDQGRPVPSAAEQTVRLLPANDRPFRGQGSSQFTRKKAHPWKSFSPSDSAPHLLWRLYRSCPVGSIAATAQVPTSLISQFPSQSCG